MASPSQLPLEAALLPIALLITGALLAFRGQATPSRRLAMALVTLLALTPTGFLWSGALTLIELAALTLILLLLADRFLFSAGPAEIDARRVLPERLSMNQPNPALITLYNNSDDALRVELIDPIPTAMRWRSASPSGFTAGSQFPAYARTLAPRQRETIEYEVSPLRRGSFTFEPIRLRYRSRLGLLWIQQRAARRDVVKAYPDLKRIAQLRVRFSVSGEGGDFRSRRLGLQGTEFSALRPYVAGDDLRHVAWRATARMDAPVTQVWRPEADQPILILLDAGRTMNAPLANDLTRFDWALTAALSLAGVAIDHGDRVGVIAFDQRVTHRSPIAGGRAHFNRMLDALHALQPTAQEPDYEGVMLKAAKQLRRRSLVVAFVDLVDPLASHSLARGLQAFSKRHLLLAVSFQDPALSRQAEQYPETLQGLYEKSVALDLAQLRQRAYADLSRRTRAAVVDAEPARLDEALLNRYMAIKYKTRL
ncbi:MAG: DUF58 domain-containing protein [Vampirovibrionales bacterium]|nr:DUF58 domain-containing protein [Vampirovibrionales bacterium]